MKRTLAIFAIFGIIVSGAFGQQLRVTGQWSMQDDQEHVIDAARDGHAAHLGGIGTEFVIRHVGFGSALVMSFEDKPENQWTMDWDLRTYMSYHFFRDRSFLDPFVQGGVGMFGEMDVDSSGCDPEADDYGEVDRVALAFYPYIGAGLGLNFCGGLYMSGQLNWRPDAGTPPCSDTLEFPSMKEYEVVLAVGYAFGGRR